MHGFYFSHSYLLACLSPFNTNSTLRRCQLPGTNSNSFLTFVCWQACIGGWLNGYNYRCQPVDYSNTPHALRVASGCWWYYFSKFTEFFDTVSGRE